MKMTFPQTRVLLLSQEISWYNELNRKLGRRLKTIVLQKDLMIFQAATDNLSINKAAIVHPRAI